MRTFAEPTPMLHLEWLGIVECRYELVTENTYR